MSFVTNLGSFRSASSGFLGKDDSASGVVAGSYTSTNLTVDAAGRITAAANGSGGTVTSVATGTGLSGGPITTTGTINLANTAVTAGSYTSTNLTVDAQGRITAAANGSGGTQNVVQAVKTDTFSTVSTAYVVVTGLTATITPSSATSKVLLTGVIAVSHEDNTNAHIQLYRDATPIMAADAAGTRTVGTAAVRQGLAGVVYTVWSVPLAYLDSPATTSAVTYGIYVKTSDATKTTVVNGTVNDPDSFGIARCASSLIVTEMKQ